MTSEQPAAGPAPGTGTASGTDTASGGTASGGTASGGTASGGHPAEPAVVVHGAATPEELAALVAVLTAASGGGEPAPAETPSVWGAHAAAMRRPVGHGPGAWRTSLRT